MGYDYVTLSKFYSDDESRMSIIREGSGKRKIFVVSCSDEKGKINSSIFDTVEEAEEFAKNFVSNHE